MTSADVIACYLWKGVSPSLTSSSSLSGSHSYFSWAWCGTQVSLR